MVQPPTELKLPLLGQQFGQAVSDEIMNLVTHSSVAVDCRFFSEFGRIVEAVSRTFPYRHDNRAWADLGG